MSPQVITVVSVTSRPIRHSTLYRIRSEQGDRFSTESMWMASLCQRAQETKMPIKVWSTSGWFDSTLTHAEFVTESEATP